jgi:uncharacterized membrane protein
MIIGLISIYIVLAVISFYFFHKKVLKKVCELYNSSDEHNHAFCYLYGTFWLAAIVINALTYIYLIPRKIVKVVEKRREKFK